MNTEDEWAMVYLVSVYGHLNRTQEAAPIVGQIDRLRSLYSRGPLTWENVDTELYIGRFPAASGNLGDKAVMRDGLLKAGVVRGYSWAPLIDTLETGSAVPDYTIEGATIIDVATAKNLHQRNVRFIEIFMSIPSLFVILARGCLFKNVLTTFDDETCTKSVFDFHNNKSRNHH